ncbi:MAG: hypothetical protein WCY80_06495, partial [Candidatus Izemoplasmatales bacterium]
MILPKPKKIVQKQNFFDIKKPISINYSEDLTDLKVIVDEYFNFKYGEKSNELVFTKVEDLAQEEYCLDISETKIEVFYNDYRSAVF